MTGGIGHIEIALVLARARNGTIGAENGLPWRLPRDLRRFKAVTLGKPVVMGRKTHESIGRPLPGRDNIVISRQHGYRAPGCRVATGLDEAIALAEATARTDETGEICIVGGGEIYRAALGRASRIYLTEIHADIDGDVTLPQFPGEIWRETEREDVRAETGETADFSFVVLERRDPASSPVDAGSSST